MLTGERRGVRRGMTVLGKIPAVPKPINLPSQRLENRGLDPNVELVPRGTVTWAGRSPPSSNGPWAGTQPSSPPVSSGAWGNASSKSASAPAWVTNTGRPSSAGSARPGSEGTTRPLSSGGPRPASAGSRHLQDLPRPSSAGTEEPLPAQNAWGPAGTRVSQAEVPPAARPRSADSGPNSRLSNEYPNGPPGSHWGPGHGRKPDEGPQPSRFTLSNGDFPTLGSEKNPNLRPQQRDRSDDRAPPHEEKPPSSGGSGQYDEYYHQGPRFHDGDANGWFRPPMDRDGFPPSNSWRRDGPHDPPPEDHWRIPGGPYGPGGPPRFPNPDFVQRFGPPGSYGRGAADGFAPPFMRPERPGHHFAPGMFPGPYDGAYYYPPPNYNMEEMMWGGPGGPPAAPGPGPGRYFQPGPHDFPRPPHGAMGPGPRPRPMPPHTGFGQDSEGFHPDHKLKEGENEFRRPGAETSGRHEPKRPMQGRPFGQRDWGNEEPMDFSKPVFDKEPPAATKNHKVTFKVEPSVADVAILRKPQPGNSVDEDQKVDSRPHDEPSQANPAKLLEEKRDNAAGVLGKCPAPLEDSSKTSADATKGSENAAAHQAPTKGKAKASAHESEREWRPKQHPDSPKQSDGEKPELGGTDNAAAYDYEAQRAKLKEIAAQRARQLQKEEEERIKEMRAKAQAKLDELNRRSTAVPNEASSSTEEIEEARGGDDKAATSGTDGQEVQEVKTFVKADPAKRRDRRGGFKKERSRAQQRKETGGTKGLESPKEEKEAGKKDSESPRESKESATKELEPSAAAAKSSMTKAADDTTSTQEPPFAAEVREEQTGQGDQQHQQRHPRHRGRQQLKQVTKPETPELATTLEDGSSSKGNGERGPRKYQRKYQGSRRSSKPQDVRAGDKVPAGEGMVWAPVRPSSAPQSQYQPKGHSDTWSAKEDRQNANAAWEVKEAGRDNSRSWDAEGKEFRRDSHRDSPGWSGEGKEGRGDVKEGGRRDNHHNHRSGWREGEGRGGGRENHRDGWSEGGRSEVREGRGGREHRERENRDHRENRDQRESRDQRENRERDHRDNREFRGRDNNRDQTTGWGSDVKEHRGGNHHSKRQAHQQVQQADHNTTSSNANANASSSSGAGGATGWGGDTSEVQVRGGSNNQSNNVNKNWGSEEKESRGGGYHHHSRRGPRFGARGGRGGDVGNRGDKQPRMVIDATGGAVPSQVAG